LIRHTRLGQFLLAANQFNESIQTTKNPAALKHAFLQENYPNYKELCDYDVFALIKQLAELSSTEPASQIAERIQARVMPKTVRLDYVDLQLVEDELRDFKMKYRDDFQDWQLVMIQTPHQSYSDEDEPILVVNEQREIKPIGHYSFMLNAISDKLEHVAFLSIDAAIADDRRVVKFLKELQALPTLA
jgi:hypothetical protein